MKVLHLGRSDLDGGAAKASFRIHSGLVSEGVDSKMLVSKRLSDDKRVIGPVGFVQKSLSHLAPHIDQIPTQLLKTNNPTLHSSAWFPFEWFTGVLDKIKNLNPDIVQLHWICGGFLRPESLPKIEKPLVWRLADMWAFSGAEHYSAGSSRFVSGYQYSNRPDTESGFDLNAWVWRRKKKSWKNLNNLTLVAPSHWMAKQIQSSELFRENRVEVIPTGQNTSIFKPISKTFARELLGLPLNKKIILFGSLSSTQDRRKGFQELLLAMQDLSKQGLGSVAEIVVFGSTAPENPPDFGFKTHYLGRFHDEVSLSLVYSSADLFVAPSTEENLANTVIEAMACGIPVVSFDVGGMPDIVLHEKNGWLAKPKDISNLAKGISWLLNADDNQEWIQNIRRIARETVVSGFSIENQTRKFISLYKDILKSP